MLVRPVAADPGGHLAALGWSDRVATLFGDLAVAGSLPARVVRVERSCCFVVGGDGNVRSLALLGQMAVGDWVATTATTVQLVLPRWSALSRLHAAGTGTQVLAANVDIVLITAPADRLRPSRVERELALALDSGARPVIVLTKLDLDTGGLLRDLRARLGAVEVIGVSAASGDGLDAVRGLLRPAHTAVLLGASGAGKSTLVNALVGEDLQATGAVRSGDQRGRHTTSSRQLIVVPGGGVLIDTPGVRSLGLTGEGDLDQVFPEIEALAAGCRFGDCRHLREPGCAVTDAVASGLLDPSRLASFNKLHNEVAVEERRHDPLARREAGRLRKHGN